MKLTAELLEACTNAQGQYEEDLKTAEVGLQIANENERTAKLQKENAEKQYEAMKKEMEDNQKMMKDASKSEPASWVNLQKIVTVQKLTEFSGSKMILVRMGLWN